MEFQYYIGAKIDFGVGAIKRLPERLKEANISAPCLVTDTFLARQPFVKELSDAIPNLEIYTGVKVNPTVTSVDECAAFFREKECDGMIALGGGSVMDTVKGAAVCAGTGKSVARYLSGGDPASAESPDEVVPFIAIPTTSGTGSEVSQYAVITDESTLRKESISSDRIYPCWAIVDPQLTYDLPDSITIATGLDVLSHAIEGITSTIENPIADILALEAIRKVFQYLPGAVREHDHQARQEMALAAVLAGMAMSHCCGTLPHGMGCPLSSHCNVPHGLAVGVLQIPAIRLLKDKCMPQFNKIAAYIAPECRPQLREDGAQYLISRIERLFAEVGREADLREYNITREQIAAMTKDAMAHGCTALMPVTVEEETICRIYTELAQGEK